VLNVGVARVEITPSQNNIVLAGAVGGRNLARFVLDPLFARAVVFEQGGKKLCLLVLDVIAITLPYTRRIRAAAEKLGIKGDDVIVQATQTHSAPSIGLLMFDPDLTGANTFEDCVTGHNTAYDDFVVERAIEAIRQASASIKGPVQLAAGSAYEDGLAFNRRAVQKDGSVMMPWFHYHEHRHGPTHIIHMEGPMDPQVGVLALRDDAMRMSAVLAHYTCHPVNVYGRDLVSADWPGALCAALDRSLGAGTTAITVNGCCGDVNPWPPGQRADAAVRDHVTMGERLSRHVVGVLEQARFAPVERIDSRVRHLKIPFRPMDPKRVEESKALWAKHPTPPWNPENTQIDSNWMMAGSILSADLCTKRDKIFDYEIQAFRIGDIAILSLPGEPFAITQMQIKMKSKARLTICAHMTTQYVGYVPLRDSIPRGGHESNTGWWSKLSPDAADMIVEGASSMINEMF
jgi:neutral ceramidase